MQISIFVPKYSFSTEFSLIFYWFLPPKYSLEQVLGLQSSNLINLMKHEKCEFWCYSLQDDNDNQIEFMLTKETIPELPEKRVAAFADSMKAVENAEKKLAKLARTRTKSEHLLTMSPECTICNLKFPCISVYHFVFSFSDQSNFVVL